ncbi:MAG: hypothetical protein NTX15_00430 [Candidatus Kapabacteria bacterium]|nr:hypothetical protein [Candidatus Kapabacteria bacterium]
MSGPDAVSPQDIDGNGTPDYVDECLRSLEFAWRAEIDTLGYLPPPSDGVEGGSPAMDVYLRDLSQAGPSGTSYYGLTTLEKLIGSVPIDRYTTWMDVDNDFSDLDKDAYGRQSFSTFGIDALRVTCAHEFHHTIQNGSYGLSTLQLMFYELSSTWMELRVWPAVEDWLIYTNELFKDPSQWPFSEPTVSNGYVWGWYGNVLSDIAPTTMRATWEKISKGTKPFKALVDACFDNGASFADVFCRQLPVMYQTGSRGSGNSVIPNATSLTEIRLHSDERAVPPSVIATGSVRPFEVRALRFSVPSVSSTEPVSVAVLITWPNEDALVNGSTLSSEAYTVTVSSRPQPTDAIIPGTTWGLRVSPATICSVLIGAQTRKPASPYPQPISLSATQRLFVPIDGGIPGEDVTMSLMGVSTIGITTVKARIELQGDLIVAPFDLPVDIPPGTYLVRVELDGVSTLLKIAVRR